MVKRLSAINLPNALTVFRVVLTPLFAICMIKKYTLAALLLFITAAVTDGLDGLLARLLRQKTPVGAFLDPAADKLLLTTAFVTLAIQELVPSWLAVIVITRDVVIFIGVALLNIMNRTFEVKPKMSSKITTIAQISTIVSVLLGLQEPAVAQIQWLLFWFTAAITTISGFQYMYVGLIILQEEPNSDT